MPYFVVKIVTRDGAVRPPLLANSETPEAATECVKYFAERLDQITAKPIREDVAIASFGEVKPNHAMTCWSWIWSRDGEGHEIEILKE